MNILLIGLSIYLCRYIYICLSISTYIAIFNSLSYGSAGAALGVGGLSVRKTYILYFYMCVYIYIYIRLSIYIYRKIGEEPAPSTPPGGFPGSTGAASLGFGGLSVRKIYILYIYYICIYLSSICLSISTYICNI